MKLRTRKNMIFASLLFPFVLLLATPAIADDPPDPAAVEQPVDAPAAQPGEATDPVEDIENKEPGDLINGIVQAFNGKDWGVFAGLVIMALIWVLKKFVWKALSTSWLPWISAGVGVAAAIATSLATGMLWWKAILNGLTVGAAASGLWSLIGKHVFGKNEPAEAEG